MTSFPWLTVLGAIPLVGAVVVWLLPSGVAARAKQVALGFSLVTLVLTAIVAVGYHQNGAEKYTGMSIASKKTSKRNTSVAANTPTMNVSRTSMSAK